MPLFCRIFLVSKEAEEVEDEDEDDEEVEVEDEDIENEVVENEDNDDEDVEDEEVEDEEVEDEEVEDDDIDEGKNCAPIGNFQFKTWKFKLMTKRISILPILLKRMAQRRRPWIIQTNSQSFSKVWFNEIWLSSESCWLGIGKDYWMMY